MLFCPTEAGCVEKIYIEPPPHGPINPARATVRYLTALGYFALGAVAMARARSVRELQKHEVMSSQACALFPVLVSYGAPMPSILLKLLPARPRRRAAFLPA